MFALSLNAARWIACVTVFVTTALAWGTVLSDLLLAEKGGLRLISHDELRVRFGGQGYAADGECEEVSECFGNDVYCNQMEDCTTTGENCLNPGKALEYAMTESCEPPAIGSGSCSIFFEGDAVCTSTAPCICNSKHTCTTYGDQGNWTEFCVPINFGNFCNNQDDCK